MAITTKIHFVRHGAVENPQKTYYGRLPGFHLSMEGIQQSKCAAEVLKQYDIEAIFHSPLKRAAETAAFLAEPFTGIKPKVRNWLNEAFSPFDGKSEKFMNKRKWDVYTGTKPPYEQPEDILRRAQEFMRMVRREYYGRHVIAVTHGDLIAFVVLWIKQLPITPQEKVALYNSFLTNASISSLTFTTKSEEEIPKLSTLKLTYCYRRVE